MAANEEKRNLMEKEQDRITKGATGSASSELPFGEPILICPGLYRVRVPLPHNPLQALNSYFILGDETTTIVDVGFNHPACEEALDKALESLGRSWDGVEYELRNRYALCRCGASRNKPFCDAMHVTVGFEDGLDDDNAW